MQNIFRFLSKPFKPTETMQATSLSDQLPTRRCEIEGKEFVPLDSLERVVTTSNIAGALRIRNTAQSNLPSQVVERARKVFAALVLMEKPDAIEGLLNEQLTDQHLPLSYDPDSNALRSCDCTMHFPFRGWSKLAVRDFQSHKQWLFLAPVFETSGQLLELEPNRPLPFTESCIKGSGAAGIVHWARVHEAHQQGFDAETLDMQVAVKQFHHKADFVKENEILQKIKDLQHKHIIRHLADGGNLHEFWETQELEMTGSHALWTLKQMSGLATALHLLHQKFNCRHGDLKPGNILCYTTGRSGGGAPILKIADFGISHIHLTQTMARKEATTTLFLTAAYQGPEVKFKTTDNTSPQPQSRKYDIWSLGCIFLEFLIWFLHGFAAVDRFDSARGITGSSNNNSASSCPWYEVTDKARKAAKIHKLVEWTIEQLQSDPRCAEETALAALISIIKDRMLQPDIDKRLSAREISQQLQELVLRGEKDPSYLLHGSCELQGTSLDFDKFLSSLA